MDVWKMNFAGKIKLQHRKDKRPVAGDVAQQQVQIKADKKDKPQLFSSRKHLEHPPQYGLTCIKTLLILEQLAFW